MLQTEQPRPASWRFFLDEVKQILPGRTIEVAVGVRVGVCKGRLAGDGKALRSGLARMLAVYRRRGGEHHLGAPCRNQENTDSTCQQKRFHRTPPLAHFRRRVNGRGLRTSCGEETPV